MAWLSDIEIAQQAQLKNITEIAEGIGITADEIEPYGHYKAKISDTALDRLKDNPDGKKTMLAYYWMVCGQEYDQANG